MPQGCIGVGENMLDTAFKTAHEETGVNFESLELLGNQTGIGMHTLCLLQVCQVTVATIAWVPQFGIVPALRCDASEFKLKFERPHKFTEIRWVTLK